MTSGRSFWTATVNQVTGATSHLVPSSDGFASVATPVALRIVHDDAGYLLLRLDDSGECVADTWHSTFDEALAQAEFEYQVPRDAWTRKQD